MFVALLLTAVVASAIAAPNPTNVFEIDISPEEAQKLLASPPFSSPKLSGKTAELPLVRWNDPKFRTAEAGPTLGHYWKNGKEIENVDDYVEEVYDASQYHGQDGLGGFAYGYETPESSKVEKGERNGDVRGEYVFKSGQDLIKVRYWADSEGFHQEDNVPRDLPQESEDVRQARLAHQKAWEEAAAAAAQQPDPQGEYNPAEYETSASEQRTASVAVPREGKAYYSAQSQAQYSTGQQRQYSTGQQRATAQAQVKNQQQQEEVEPTGPPRGFFYSFNYPVSIIKAKNEGGAQPSQPGYPVDQDTVAVGNYRQG